MIKKTFLSLRNLVFKKPQKEYKGKILLIGGGEIFNTYDSYIMWLRELELHEQNPSWKSWLAKVLDQHNIEVIRLHMPNTFNAKYIEWQIMFSKYIYLIDSQTSLVGHSLGAMFLLKFLAENPEIEKIVKSVYLVSPSFDEAYTFAIKTGKLPNYPKYYFYQSYDDDIVPWNESTTKKIEEMGLNKNNVMVYQNRGHFLQPNFVDLKKHILKNYK
jgi:predicted alpha/beta hydrolase family esterase